MPETPFARRGTWRPSHLRLSGSSPARPKLCTECGHAGLQVTLVFHGAASFAFFLGTITQLVASGNLAAARIATEKFRIDSFLRARRIPARLAGRVRAHHLAQLQRDLEQEERDLVQGAANTLSLACMHALWHACKGSAGGA